MIPTVEFIYGGGGVKRFHTMPTIQDDTVAQHSFGVAWMVWLLTNGTARAELIMAALAHDLAEQHTGDIPAPAKRALGIGAQFRAYEAIVEEKQHINFQLTVEEQRTLKVADCLDGLARCAMEISLGNKHAKTARTNFMLYLQELVLQPNEFSILNAVTRLAKETV